ncbi:hypothetical protein BD410DRAFT_837571 [Rickenella mellea]|uniref:HSF-type DNA-binding domain-containing protein n=1 Tax=Rickenella mellea TaxID=50990 RepID=A0A4Y7QEV2_9AGAM|nr:hypothetical protein BD410DRAFT_837571 [Rickenella mellea]
MDSITFKPLPISDLFPIMNHSSLPQGFPQGSNDFVPMDSLYSPNAYPPSPPQPSGPSLPFSSNLRATRLSPNRMKQESSPTSQALPNSFKDLESDIHSGCDFVQKLMLEDSRLTPVVSWTSNGDAFVVKDVTAFTRSILPKLFRHSNFASFVRQLNKYDFHKVKNPDDPFGQHTWTFRHPDFHADRRSALENIKRKAPGVRRKPTTAASQAPVEYASPRGSPSSDGGTVDDQLLELERLRQSQDSMAQRLRRLEGNYVHTLEDLVDCHKNIAKQEDMMQSLIQYIVQGDLFLASSASQNPAFLPESCPFLSSMDTQRAFNSSSGNIVGHGPNDEPGESFNTSSVSDAMAVDTMAQFGAQSHLRGCKAPPTSPEDALHFTDDLLFSSNFVQQSPLAPSRLPGDAVNGLAPLFNGAEHYTMFDDGMDGSRKSNRASFPAPGT